MSFSSANLTRNATPKNRIRMPNFATRLPDNIRCSRVGPAGFRGAGGSARPASCSGAGDEGGDCARPSALSAIAAGSGLRRQAGLARVDQRISRRHERFAERRSGCDRDDVIGGLTAAGKLHRSTALQARDPLLDCGQRAFSNSSSVGGRCAPTGAAAVTLRLFRFARPAVPDQPDHQADEENRDPHPRRPAASAPRIVPTTTASSIRIGPSPVSFR
jgi:hypothetical protein